MRKRYVLSGAFALTLMASSAVAFGDNLKEDDSSSPETTAASDTVTLPTGDAVTLSEDGGINIAAADDRDSVGFISPPALDGSEDVMVIPDDRAADIANGDENPALYNVSALLRSGQNDARDVDYGALEDTTYGQFAPIEPSTRSDDEETVEVEFEITGLDGEPEELAAIYYVSLVDGERSEVPVEEDGTASAELPKGDYEFVTMTGDLTNILIGGLKGVTVDDDTSLVTFDGTEALNIDATLDGADVDGDISTNEIGVDTPAGAMNFTQGEELVGDAEFYVLPFEPGEGETHRMMAHFPTYVDDDARYHLGFEELDGVSEDISYSVDVEDLVEVNTRYDSLGVDDEVGRGGPSGFPANSGGSFRLVHDLEIPSEQTDFLMPSDSVIWQYRAEIGGEREGALVIDRDIDLDEKGPIEQDMVHAPLSLSLSGSDLGRFGDSIEAFFLPIDNGLENELVATDAVTGKLTLERDGEVLDSVDDVAGALELPEGDSGRYTLTVESSNESEFTDLATETRGTWEFESEPTDEEFAPLDVSSIVFQADGLRDGYAPVDEPLEFTMDYLPQNEMVDGADLETIKAEVSYDDGETWEELEVDVDGNQVTGTMDLDADADFASIRTMAEDSDGNEVTQETIRSFGLD